MQRAEAERWLGIAAKLLAARDFHGSKTFALKAREVDQNNLICDQILAVVDTVLAGEKRVNTNQQPDWYGVLQLPQLVRDGDVIADHYRKLVACLNPERNKFPFADYALQLVVDAWGVLSDPNKKWLFDCQLGLFLQSQGGGEVDVDPVVAAAVAQQPQNINMNNSGGGGGGGGGDGGGGLMDGGIGVTNGRGNAAVGGGGGYQLNTFQLFQGQPEPPQQHPPPPPPQQQMFQSQIPQQQQQMWQSQAQPQSQNQQQQYNFMHVQSQPQSQAAAQQQQQMNFMPQSQQQQQQQQQINFMHVQSQPQPQSQQQHNFMPIQNQPQSQQHNFMPIQNQPQSQQIPQQWQMQDAAPLQGGGSGGGGGSGERNRGILNAIGGVNRGVTQNANVSPTIRPVPRGISQGFLSSTPVPMARVAATTRVGSSGGDGNASGTTSTLYNNNSSTWNFDRNYNSNLNDNDDYGNFNDGIVDDVDDENDEEDVVVEVDGFWTACPYCFYVFEYEKMYLDCALRCQICRRGFHAVQIPKPPPFAGEGGGGGGGNKEKKNPFCTWGFFPLGFSMKAWKKQIKAENMKGSSSWEPFTPLISCPVENVGGGFKWFDADDGNALIGPKGDLVKSTPWVYIDDDGDVSEPSDVDLSDGDWRTAKHNKSKRRRSTTFGVHRVGRPRKDTAPLAAEVVLALSAEDKSDARKTVSASRAKKLNSKNVKNVGRLDLNVEFNNNGEDHAPRVNAASQEEDGIENIAFFEGLDEFMSSLPILNVNGDGKTKPS